MSPYSSNGNTVVDDDQRILDQYPDPDPGQRGIESSNSKPLFKGGRSVDKELSSGVGIIRKSHHKSTITIKDIRRKHRDIFSALLLLSRGQTIYLGYYGYGATKKWRYQGFKEGTIAALEKIKDNTEISALEYLILENLAYDGTIFASFDSLMEHIKQAETHNLPSSSKVS